MTHRPIPPRSESERIELLKARAKVPVECGDEMRTGPGQAPLIPFYPVVVMVDAKGREQAVELGYRGRAAARVADVFDLMLARQSRAHFEAHGPLFDPGQLAIARLYRALVEDVSRGNMRGTNLMSSGGGGLGNDDGFLASFTDRQRQIAAMRRRVGPLEALSVQRGGQGGRVAITCLDLVDRVCVGQLTLSQVLRGAGWASDGKHRAILRAALQESLDRMQGYPGRPDRHLSLSGGGD